MCLAVAGTSKHSHTRQPVDPECKRKKNPHKPRSSACCSAQWTSPTSVCPEAQQLILGSTEWREGTAGSIVPEDAVGCANVCMYRGQTSSH